MKNERITLYFVELWKKIKSWKLECDNGILNVTRIGGFFFADVLIENKLKVGEIGCANLCKLDVSDNVLRF